MPNSCDNCFGSRAVQGLPDGEPLIRHQSTLLWITFVAIAAADVVLPGPSFSVFCLPVFFAFLVLARPRYPWPLTSAAACFLLGTWLLEQGLRSSEETALLDKYHLADRLLISLAILLVTAVHARVQRIHDDVAALHRRKADGTIDALGDFRLAALRSNVVGASLVTLAVVFGLDAITPRELNVGTLYLLPVLWASSIERPLVLAVLVPLAAGLSMGGFFLGPSSMIVPEPAIILLERIITILAVLGAGIVLIVYSVRQGRKVDAPQGAHA
jgi:hypothetical protein